MKSQFTMPTVLKIKDKIHQRSIKIAPFKKDIRKTLPHKHNSYFEIIYLSEGTGFHSIDSIKYQVQPPVVYTVRKEQVHHWELESEPEGYVLILKKEFLDNSLDKQLKDLLANISAFPSICLADPLSITQLFKMLTDEYDPEQSNNTPVIEGLLKALLAKILQTGKPLPSAKGKKDNLFQEFQQLLTQDKLLKNSVAFYAFHLNTSPQNLNAACRKSAGQPAAQVLAEFIINEAKRLLLYTDMAVSEISNVLDFKDDSHFIKYFKRHCGQTPNAFRVLV
ncbi:HTH-type transcriptional activator RhaS [Dyadobacter sp. CECT 9623]|uniref:HTH-type transcriptional activator RhaS n=2 Tax=Dyadobacter linearis TaxID=2823330 RepID=A0ABN7RIU6_9BACT|nr:HTH-type transcriptional activator RhaS [Dyadobacter sp. CECT 9623]